MPSTERTLVLVKPDGVQRLLIGRILARYEERGLKLVGLKLVQTSRDLAERHYAVHRERPFFGSLVDFITSSPLVALALEGPNAIAVVRAINGATKPHEAPRARSAATSRSRPRRTSSTRPMAPSRPRSSSDCGSARTSCSATSARRLGPAAGGIAGASRAPGRPARVGRREPAAASDRPTPRPRTAGRRAPGPASAPARRPPHWRHTAARSSREHPSGPVAAGPAASPRPTRWASSLRARPPQSPQGTEDRSQRREADDGWSGPSTARSMSSERRRRLPTPAADDATRSHETQGEEGARRAQPRSSLTRPSRTTGARAGPGGQRAPGTTKARTRSGRASSHPDRGPPAPASRPPRRPRSSRRRRARGRRGSRPRPFARRRLAAATRTISPRSAGSGSPRTSRPTRPPSPGRRWRRPPGPRP